MPADGTEVVFSDTSPYVSRALVVECDGATSAAYLHGTEGAGALHGAVWLANHVPGPAEALEHAGRVQRIPVLTRSDTKHPDGRDHLRDLSTLWFEEGDGVALYEGDELLAVIPGWADLAHGMPGYARDALRETPFAWPLDEAMEGLGPRVKRARDFWDWRRATGRWGAYRTSVLNHLRDRIGPPGDYWDATGDGLPKVGISAHTSGDLTILSTAGMSCQRMPAVEQYAEDAGRFARIELAVATRGDSRMAARVFLWLARYPWRSVTWLGHGHTARWYHEPSTFPLGPEWAGVAFLADVGGLPGPSVPDSGTIPLAPDLSGFVHRDDPVTWLWLIPVTGDDLRSIADDGHRTFLEKLDRSWVLS